jgi:hypothetical protein
MRNAMRNPITIPPNTPPTMMPVLGEALLLSVLAIELDCAKESLEVLVEPGEVIGPVRAAKKNQRLVQT